MPYNKTVELLQQSHLTKIELLKSFLSAFKALGNTFETHKTDCFYLKRVIQQPQRVANGFPPHREGSPVPASLFVAGTKFSNLL